MVWILNQVVPWSSLLPQRLTCSDVADICTDPTHSDVADICTNPTRSGVADICTDLTRSGVADIYTNLTSSDVADRLPWARAPHFLGLASPSPH